MTVLWVVPYPVIGAPKVLLISTTFPIWIGSVAFSFDFILLVLGISIEVVYGLSILYPLTYALPGEILKQKKSSVGVFPLWVNSFSKNNPLFPNLSLRLSLTSMENGFT